MTCSTCNGKGRIIVVTFDDKGNEIITGFPVCSDCDGKGEV